MSSVDRTVLRVQLGREPRGSWRVVSRCRHGAPVVIATNPLLDGGEPFPTLFWLTCPVLSAAVSALESSGETDAWTARLVADGALAVRMQRADERYRDMRLIEAGGTDPCQTVGIAGQRDPLKVKCLHGHVAAYLAGIDDPVGGAVAKDIPQDCDDARCLKGEGD